MRVAALLLVVAVACGGTTSGGDAGWTTCSSPAGVLVCGGPNACPDDTSKCGCLLPVNGGVGICATQVDDKDCVVAGDGFVCIETDFPNLGDWYEGPFDLGVLFAANGAAARVRYADDGAWTGDPLPVPSSCPTMQNGFLCGGACGNCPANHRCHGRSPLHPVGICVPQFGDSFNDSCNSAANQPCFHADDACFSYKVEPEAQAFADALSICLPSAFCAELSQSLPGNGVFCN